MVATITTNKALSEPANGDPNWDVNLNDNFTAIDKAFGSFINIATTIGNYNLVTADLQNMCFKSNTSAFTANVTYTIPNGVAGQWVVVNQSAASAFTLSVVCGASTVLVDRSTVRSIYCDGTTVSYADTPFGPNPTLSGTITISGGTQNWTVIASTTNLTFAYNGVNKMRLDSSGNITVTGNVTAYGTIA
jgi:hypothetical protein